MRSGNNTSFILTTILSLTLVGYASGADISVSGTGDNLGGDGSFADPYRNVRFAMDLADPGDTIKVRSGDYGVGDGETFPIPIKSGVRILGQETLLANWPKIGGDVNDTNIAGLFVVDATTSNRNRIDLSKLFFVGENTASKDAPSSLRVVVADGNEATVVVDNCHFERSEMNISGASGRPTLDFLVGWGEATITITGSTIYASERSGVEMNTGSDTTVVRESLQTLVVEGCDILAEGTDLVSYGVRWHAAGEKWVEGNLTVTGNLIDSSGASSSSYGIETGILASIESDGDGDISLDHQSFFIVRNRIQDCRGDGIWLRNDPQDVDAAAYMAIFDLRRNRVSGCGGAGLRIQRDDTGGFGGYLLVQSVSNWYVQNGDGIRIQGDGQSATTGSYFVNDTIAHNSASGYGFVIEDSFGNGPAQISNCIVYGNHAGGAQYDAGSTGWTPSSAYTTTEYCNWQNYTGGVGNIDADPDFVNVSTGDFHLADEYSSCVDAGTNVPAVVGIGEFDIDSGDRKLDGDGDTNEVVDIGADEFDPDP